MKQMRISLCLLAVLASTVPVAYAAAPTTFTPPAASAAIGAIPVANTFVPRSQGRNKYLQVAGSVGHTHLYDVGCMYGTFDIAPEYTRSFRPSAIAGCLFGGFLADENFTSTSRFGGSCGNSCGDSTTLLIQGSDVTNRSSQALIANNFYLPSDYSSRVTFSPRITNAMLNFDMFLGLDTWCTGMYVRVYGPFVHTKWNLDICETQVNKGTLGYTSGAFTETNLPRASLLNNFLEYAAGKAPESTRGNGNAESTGVATVAGTTVTSTVPFPNDQRSMATIFDGLQSARMLQQSETRNGFSDLWLELGWDFWNCDDFHIGVDLLLNAPTGVVNDNCLLFAPRVGNNAWEAGGGLTAHYVFWRSECEDAHFGLYVDANFTHIFKHRETRTFDLKGRSLSRYQLAARFATNESTLEGNPGAPEPGPTPQPNSLIPTGPTTGVFTPADFVFANEFAPVANLTQRNVRVSVNWQTDIVAMFNLTYCNFSWDIGYDFWARSKEKISKSDCQRFALGDNDAKWGIKGNARVIAYNARTLNGGVGETFFPVRLSATENTSLINSVPVNVTNIGGNALTAITVFNTDVDNAQFAYAPDVVGTDDFEGALSGFFNTPVIANAVVTVNQGAAIQIKTSIQPILLAEADINYNQVSRGLSNTIFTHLQYNFDCECWTPYIGIGGFGEFGRKRCGSDNDCDNKTNVTTVSVNNSCDNDCSGTSTRCAISQWGIWVKGGVSFN